jgi:hypothetical protein
MLEDDSCSSATVEDAFSEVGFTEAELSDDELIVAELAGTELPLPTEDNAGFDTESSQAQSTSDRIAPQTTILFILRSSFISKYNHH